MSPARALACALTFSLALMPGAAAQVLTIESPNVQASAGFGASLAPVGGDINGDGIPDLLVGSGNEDVGDEENAGRAYALSGADGSLLLALESPDVQAYGFFGNWVASAGGDLNGDGVPDLLVGASGEDVESLINPGRAYVLSGTDGSVLLMLESPNAEYLGSFGASVASAGGDLNADGVPDLLVGAYREDADGQEDAGRAYSISGADGSVLLTLISPNSEESGGFGASVAPAEGDIDGDGVPDLLVGAYLEDIGDQEDAGRVYVHSGANGLVLHTIESPNPEEGGYFGRWVVPVRGDLDGDGVPDLLVGAGNEDVGEQEDAGRAYAFSGADGSLLLTLQSPNPEGDGFFRMVAPAGGDLDGDGVPDLLVGAYNEDVGDQEDAGRVYAFSGADGSLLLTLQSPNPEDNGFFGIRVAPAGGDFDTDDVPDILIGANGETVDGQGIAGRVYVFSGSTSSVSVEPRTVPPVSLVLHPAFPNPSRQSVRVPFGLAEPGEVRLAVYDLLGREVVVLVEGSCPAGRQEVVFDRGGLAPGMYLMRLEVEGARAQTRSVLLVR